MNNNKMSAYSKVLPSLWLPLAGILLLMLLLILPETALAGRMADISSSFKMSSAEQTKQLKILGINVGILFLLLALYQLVKKKELLLRVIVPIVVLLLGCALLVIGFI